MEINLEIPTELITDNSHEIKYEYLKGKIVVGLVGYAGAGKNMLGNLLTQKLNFKDISFGDALKRDLNNYMKDAIFYDLKDNHNIDINIQDIDFLNPKNREIKEIIRPYMIWFGEEMKKLNGINHWVNRAIEKIEDKDKKIVITDVRREIELELFKFNRESFNRRINNRKTLNIPISGLEKEDYDGDFECLLLYINQLNLTDKDNLTIDTIIKSQEQWMFDHTIYVDSTIPDINEYREKHMLNHLYELVEKFPEYFV